MFKAEELHGVCRVLLVLFEGCMVNGFDAAIIVTMNGWAQQSVWFDALAHAFTNNYLFKSASLIALLYCAWFLPQPEAQQYQTRARLLVSLFAAFGAPACARLLELLLPFRPRPLHEASLNLTLPHFMRAEVDHDWSSFPSDTIALLVPLIIGLCLVSRRLGLIACGIGLLSALARMYSGLHYPTDIMGGALLGVLVFFVLDRPAIKQRITAPCFWVLEKYPQWFYQAFFLFTYQTANIYDQAFNIVKNLFKHA